MSPAHIVLLFVDWLLCLRIFSTHCFLSPRPAIRCALLMRLWWSHFRLSLPPTLAKSLAYHPIKFLLPKSIAIYGDGSGFHLYVVVVYCSCCNIKKSSNYDWFSPLLCYITLEEIHWKNTILLQLTQPSYYYLLQVQHTLLRTHPRRRRCHMLHCS